MLQFLSGFTENINYSDLTMNHLNHLQMETKPQKQNNVKNMNSSVSGSVSNSSNGVYVDLGKALLEASKSGDAEKVQECIKNGAPFITDWLGTSALHVAAKNNFYDTCATLLRSGISKDAKTKVDRTPLHFAVFEGNFEICQLLIQYECSIDPIDMLKMTPLHWAVEKGYDNIAELLLENGANPHIMSKFLKTPFLLAKEKNNDFIVNLIEMLPTTPMSLTASNNFDSSVFVKTPTKLKDESILLPDRPQSQTSTTATTTIQPPQQKKRERFHSYDSADTKRLKSSPNLTLQLLKEQMSMMSSTDDNNLIQSVLQSGRKIMLSEAGKRLLNDSSLNKFLKIPLNTTISSSPSSSINSSSRKPVSPRSAAVASTTLRRTSDSSDVLEIFRESSGIKTTNTDILNIIRSTDLQEVTITQRSSSSSSSSSSMIKASPVSSPIQKTGVSLSAIAIHKNVPKPKTQNVLKTKTITSSNQQLPLSSTTDYNNSSADIRLKTVNNNGSNNNNNNEDDFSKAETVGRKYSELLNNYQQLKRAFEREQQKSDVLQRQLTQLQSNFELYKRQQQLKFDSIIVLLQGNNDRKVAIKNDVDDDGVL